MKKNKKNEELYEAFLKCADSKWSDEQAYKKYQRLVKKHLGKNAEDRLEQSKITLQLSLVKINGWE